MISASEQQALVRLLERTAPEQTWPTLSRAGWLDLLPDATQWEYADVAGFVAGACATHRPALQVGAHLAAAAALSLAGQPPPSSAPLGFVVDVAVSQDSITGLVWGGQSSAIGFAPGLGLVRVPLEGPHLSASPLLFLGTSAVRSFVTPTSAVELIAAAAAEDHATAIASYLMAAESIAVAAAATERTRQYLLQRTAFGKPLAAQQVLQHRLVDMALNDLTGAALLQAAGRAWTTGSGHRPSWSAKLHAAVKSVWTLEQAIQLHGGIGFTQELGLADWLRVAQRSRLLLGGRLRAAREVVEAVGPVLAEPPRDWSTDFAPRHTVA